MVSDHDRRTFKGMLAALGGMQLQALLYGTAADVLEM
jgi:hypothetical protein